MRKRIVRWTGHVWRGIRRPFSRRAGPISLERRRFLRGTLAFGGLALVNALQSCVSLRRPTSPEEELGREIARMVRASPIRTALREGKSVKMAIETYPHSKILEMGFYKEKPGEIIPAGIKRDFKEIEFVGIRPNARAKIHTHTYPWDTLPPLRFLLLSNPSTTDVTSLIADMLKPGYHRLRFDHAAILDYDGKLMGYVTLQVGRKALASIRNTKEAEPEHLLAFWRKVRDVREWVAEKKRLDAVFEKAVEGNKGVDFEKLERMRGEYRQSLTDLVYRHIQHLRDLHALGFRFRVTPMRGYAYDSSMGYFQKKA